MYDVEEPLIRRQTGVVIGRETATKANKLDYIIQQHTKGSSEGSGIIPDVLDEPKDIYGSSSSSLSAFDDEVEDVSSDDEIKADENKADT
ncbi:hypothetical protein Tco_0270696 [Tanacetum coccineum]